MSQSIEFLDQIHSDLKELFSKTRQSYWFYIFFLKKSISLINVESLKYKNDVLTILKNYKALREKKSACQLKVFYTNEKKKYIREFDDYFKKNSITYKIIAFYLFK